MTNQISVKPAKKKKIASLEKRKARGGWIFVLPFIIGFVLIYLPIVFDSVYSTFNTVTTITGDDGFPINLTVWVGIDNYMAAFQNQEFLEALLTGFQDMVLQIPMILIFSLFMAVLLNQKMAGRAIFRAIFFVPVILSTGLFASIAQENPLGAIDDANSADMGDGGGSTGGIVNAMDIKQLFSGMVIGDGLLNYVVDAINDIFDIVNRSGVQMLIFLSGLQSISPAIYESVQIDGASAWETFWKITFPMISPMILVNAIYTVIDSFTAESNEIVRTINTHYIENQIEATAMSWIYFMLVLIIVGIVALVMSRFVFYQRRD